MKICIYGAGAIGSWLGAKLHIAGFNTTLVARGPHLAALQEHGLWLTENGETQNLKIPATNDAFALEPQDLIFVTLKAHSIPGVALQLKHLLHDESVVITAVNGIPWWFFYQLGAEFPQQPVKSVDPESRLWNDVNPARTVGCVLYPSTDLIAPGRVKHLSDTRLPVGEPNGETSDRVKHISSILEQAGCRAPIRSNIRNEIWIKLWGNLAFNPLSVLTQKTLDRLATDQDTRAIASDLMLECQTVGQCYNARFGMSIDRRLDGAAKVGAHKTSMLQDYIKGRPLEFGSIIDAVIELADLAQVDVPKIRDIRQRLMNYLEENR